MSIRIDLNSSISLDYEISAIEFARREGGEDVCLCVRYSDEDELDILKGLNIGDEFLPID